MKCLSAPATLKPSMKPRHLPMTSEALKSTSLLLLLLGQLGGAAGFAQTTTNAPLGSNPSLCGLPVTVQSDLTMSDSIGVSNRWSANKVWQWYLQQPWLVGCNFLPSTAVNDVEMWQSTTFDPVTIDRELAWAHSLGFNTLRVFLNYVVWEDNPGAFKERFCQFLSTADKHELLVMPILFDDCAFSGKEPRVGLQPNPVPGVHNSGWVPSPPYAMHKDRASWPDLERYVKDVVGEFGQEIGRAHV